MHMHAKSKRRYNKDERHSLLKNIPLTLLKGLYVRGSWRQKQNCNILTPHLCGHNNVSFPFSWADQPGAWNMFLNPASYLQLL